MSCPELQLIYLKLSDVKDRGNEIVRVVLCCDWGLDLSTVIYAALKNAIPDVESRWAARFFLAEAATALEKYCSDLNECNFVKSLVTAAAKMVWESIPAEDKKFIGQAVGKGLGWFAHYRGYKVDDSGKLIKPEVTPETLFTIAKILAFYRAGVYELSKYSFEQIGELTWYDLMVGEETTSLF